MTDGFKYIFDEAIQNYNKYGSRLESFRNTLNNPMLYNFMINGGEIDNYSLNIAKDINYELYSKFLNQKQKGYTGYLGCEEKYREIDDNDSKHILILTFLFNNRNFKNIVEIGGGYGNCVRLINNIISYDSWKIIDLPHINEVQKFFLEKEINDISKIDFIDGTNNQNLYFSNKCIDLVIGTHSISELSWDNFINYMKNVVIYSNYLYLGYNKNCPSPLLINNKLRYILSCGFVKIDNIDYKESFGADVSYTLFLNTNYK